MLYARLVLTIAAGDPEERTLSLLGYEPPSTNAEAIDELGLDADIDSIQRLRLDFQSALESEVVTLQDSSPDAWSDIDEYDYAEEHLDEWVKGLIQNDEARYEAILDEWLNSKIDWLSDDDGFSSLGGGESAAYQYFNCMSVDELEALGIDIIQGEHPGSSYFAAELSLDTASANQRAKGCGSKIRFIELVTTGA